MDKTQVVAAIIQRDSKFLLGKRALSKKSSPGCWSPISGRIESGESEAQAVVRECFEEIGLTVEAVRKVTEFEIDHGKTQLHWWLVRVLDGREFLKNDEHSEIRWFSVQEMKQSPGFFREDIEVFSNFLGSLKKGDHQMKAKVIFVAIFFMSFNLFADGIAADISCSFPNSSVSSIVFQNLTPGYQSGTSPLKEATLTVDGDTSVRTSASAMVMGRSSGVEGDLKDSRPAAMINFANGTGLVRLAIYYCSGNGTTVDAKLFYGQLKSQKDSSFESAKMVQGTCTGNQLRKVFTINCASFK